MASFMIFTGKTANVVLPAFMLTVSAGVSDPVSGYHILSVSENDYTENIRSLSDHINTLVPSFGDDTDHPYFHSRFSLDHWCPVLPSRDDMLARDEDSSLLFSALFGFDRGLPVTNEFTASQLAMCSLLRDASAFSEEFTGYLDRISASVDHENTRVMLLADPADPQGTGFAFAFARFFRERFRDAENAPFLGLSLISVSSAISPERQTKIHECLLHAKEHRLVRPAEGRETFGVDALWLYDLPEGIRTCDPAFSPLLIKFAASCNAFFATVRDPSYGVHTKTCPGTLSWHAFGVNGPFFMGFIKSALWFLTDLYPALKQYLEHPSLLRSISPASKNSLFRKLFRESGDMSEAELQLLESLAFVARVHLQWWNSMITGLPDVLRLSSENKEAWDNAVRAYGRVVTVGAEYDVDKAQASETGLDRFKPVHRESMADTEEERSQRRLLKSEENLNTLLEERNLHFVRMGGFRSRQVVEDCLRRCRKALETTENKLRELSSEDLPDNTPLLKAQRRMQTLSAAISRCEADLTRMGSLKALGELPSPRISLTAPYCGELLSEAMGDPIRKLLEEGGTENEELRRPIRESLAELFPGYAGADAKALFKTLQSRSASFTEKTSAVLIRSVWNIILEETLGFRIFPDPSGVPDVPLLPDLVSGDPVLTVNSAPAQIIVPASGDTDAGKRGVLAALMLLQYRVHSSEDPEIRVHTVTPANSSFSASWLDTVSASDCHIITLARDRAEFPFAVVLPGHKLICARFTLLHMPLIPDFVTWFDPTARLFLDPCPYLGGSDRILLTEQLVRLRALLNSSASGDLSDFLHSFHRDIMAFVAGKSRNTDPDLATRLHAVCGLRGLPAYGDLTRSASVYDRYTEDDLICKLLSGASNVPGPTAVVDDDIVYSWKGIPFARESSDTYLETAHHPDEKDVLEFFSHECGLLTRSSDTYHENLQTGLLALQARCSQPLVHASELFATIKKEAEAPILEKVTEYTWPWDSASPALLTIFSESLSPQPGNACLDPFSKKLALIPRQGGNILWNSVLSDICTLKAPVVDDPEAFIPDDAVLPPLSASFASLLCETSEGSTLLTHDLLSFTREGESIRVELMIHANFDLKLTKIYGPEDILTLYSRDIPTLAVWPAFPLPEDSWKVYFAYGNIPGSMDPCVLSHGTLIPFERHNDRCTLSSEFFPRCYMLFTGGESVAAIPNILPVREISSGKQVNICVDYGTSGCSVILSDENGPAPLDMDSSVGLILRHPLYSAELIHREFVPALSLPVILPSVSKSSSRFCKEVPRPFADGSLILSTSLNRLLETDANELNSAYKASIERDPYSDLGLHQIMLFAALKCRLNGVSAITWRFSLPDDIPYDRQGIFVSHIRALVDTVSTEAMFPATLTVPPVTFAPEYEAEGAYFRYCSPEETRGGFMLLDIGAETAKFSVFLRGMDNAVQHCHFPMGIRYFFVPALLAHPDLLIRDFSAVVSEAGRNDLEALRLCFASAASDPTALRKAVTAMDTYIEENLDLLRQILLSVPGGCTSTFTGALLLLYSAWLMALTGVMLLQMSQDPTRNDFLPGTMPLFLAGRGSSLLEALSHENQNKLWNFLMLYRNDHVRETLVRFSGEKKMEISAGLSVLESLSPDPGMPLQGTTDLPVHPEDLIYRFLMLFLYEYPAIAPALFPDWFAMDPNHPFTARCEVAVEAVVREAFSGHRFTDPYEALASCLTSLLESAGSLF